MRLFCNNSIRQPINKQVLFSCYFMLVVWRGKEYLEEYQKHSFDNNAFTVTYTNQENGATPQPNVPATYRI
jgi:hypothetical protein